MYKYKSVVPMHVNTCFFSETILKHGLNAAGFARKTA